LFWALSKPGILAIGNLTILGVGFLRVFVAFNGDLQHFYGYCSILLKGSLEVKLPTIWTDEKQSRAEAERRERLEKRRVEEKESEERRCRCAKR